MAVKGLAEATLGSVARHNGDGCSLIAKAAFAYDNPAVATQAPVRIDRLIVTCNIYIGDCDSIGGVTMRRLSVQLRKSRASSCLCVGAAMLGLIPPASILASPARAQLRGDHDLDENNVDPITGKYALRFLEGSIGIGEGRLALVRNHASSMDSTLWEGIRLHISQNGDQIYIDPDGQENSIMFLRSPQGWQEKSSLSPRSLQVSGATLTEYSDGYSYKSRNGTTIFFGNPVWSDAVNPDPFVCGKNATCKAYPLRISNPNGRSIVYHWDYTDWWDGDWEHYSPHEYNFRLGSISNNTGSIGFTYLHQGNDTNPYTGELVYGWNIRTGATFSDGRSVGYAYPSPGKVAITDTTGAIWHVTDQSIQGPGDSQPGEQAYYTSLHALYVRRKGITTYYDWSYNGTMATLHRYDPDGQVRTIVSDREIDAPTSDTIQAGGTTLQRLFTYDILGRLTATTGPEGERTEYEWDARGNPTLTRILPRPGTGGAPIVTTAGYPAACANPVTCNRPEWTRDAAGRQTDYTYDPVHGGLLTETLPAPSAGAPRPQTRYSYTNWGDVVVPSTISTCRSTAACAGTADETVTEMAYADADQPTSITVRAGDNSVSTTTHVSYLAAGDIGSVDGPLPGDADTTVYRYDAARRLTGVIGPDPDGGGPLRHRAQRTVYDAAGRVTAQEAGHVASQSDGDWAAFQPAQRTTLDYDADGRPAVARLIADGATAGLTQTGYDAAGRVRCVTVRMNPAAYGALPDACSQGAAGSGGADRIERLSYDPFGRLAQREEGVGTAASADAFQRGFTPGGRLAWAQDGNGNRTSYGYDGFDRLVRTTFADGSYEELGYDAAGAVASRRLRDGQAMGYGYDDLGRLVSATRPLGAYRETNKGFAWDLAGHLTQAWDSSGRSLGFGYDALGRQTSRSDNGYVQGNMSMLYDAAGRRVRLTWGDGFFVTYDHDASGATTAIRENGGAVLAAFGYDDLGRRTSLSRGNGTATGYAYDGASRLTGLSLVGGAQPNAVTFAYNAAGQIAGRTASNDGYAYTGHYDVDRGYQVNGLDQYVQAGPETFGYDARGNLTRSGTRGYGYTLENQLATAPGANLAYDPLGRLFDVDAEDGVHTALLYDGADVIAEVDQASGALLRRYVHGPGSDEPLVWYEGGQRRWLHADERGSIVAVSDDAGATLALNRYDENGIPQAGNIGRFQYTGQKWLRGLGLYDYKARMYSPTLGRFLQTDPIGYGDGMNPYAYVGNDPVNAVDPSGTECEKGRQTSDNGQPCDIVVNGAVPVDNPLPPPEFHFDPDWGDFSRLVTVPRTPGLARAPQNGQVLAANASEQRKGTRRGPTSRCPGMGGQTCGASSAAGGVNPDYPSVCPECLKGNGKWPYGGPPPETLKRGATVIGGVGIVGGVICLIVEPCGAIVGGALTIGGGSVLLTN